MELIGSAAREIDEAGSMVVRATVVFGIERSCEAETEYGIRGPVLIPILLLPICAVEGMQSKQ